MKFFASGLLFLLAGTLSVSAQDMTVLDVAGKFSERKFREAGSLAEAGIRRDSLNDALHYYYALSKYALGEKDAAQKSLEKACSIDSGNTVYSEALMNLYYSKGETSRADSICTVLFKSKPYKFRSAYSLSVMGDRAMSAGRDSLALTYFRMAVEMDPSYLPAIVGGADASRLCGNMPEFFRFSEMFISSPEVTADVKNDFLDNLLNSVDGRLFRLWGNQFDSLVESGISAHPSDSSILQTAGIWYYRSERVDKARSCLKTVSALYPDNIKFHLLLLEIETREGNSPGVIAEASGIAGLARKDVGLKLSMLDVIAGEYYKCGEKKKAWKCYRKIFAIDKDYIPALNNYAYFLALDGIKLEKACKMSLKTLRKEPENATYLDTCGWILHLLGRDEEAKVLLRKAIVKGGSGNAEILKHYSEIIQSDSVKK